MDNVTTWNMSQYAMMGLILGIFGFSGFRRGVNRELLSLVGMGLGMLLSAQLAVSLVPMVNRFYKLGRLALSGGLTSDNPVTAWQTVQDLPALVRTQADTEMLALFVFLLILVAFYLIGQVSFRPPDSMIPRILGLFMGVVTGFLFIYYFMPILFPGPEAVIRLPSGEVRDTLSNEQIVAWAITLLVSVLIIFGVYSASGAKRRK